jgi:2-dehydropantoate 2-reductase
MTLKERRMNKMKILVIGTGAIGGLYAAKLSQAGAEVSVVCRSDYEQVKQGGMKIKSLWGDFVFKPHQVLRDVKEFKEKADFILIATKVLPEISLPDIIKPVLTSETSIAIIQNGIFIEKDLAQAFPNHHLLSIIAFIAVKKEQPALVEHDDNGKLIIGEKQNPNPQKGGFGLRTLHSTNSKSSRPILLGDSSPFRDRISTRRSRGATRSSWRRCPPAQRADRRRLG